MKSPAALASLAGWRTALPATLRAFWPAGLAVERRERWRACLGAALGMLLTALGAAWVLRGQLTPDEQVLAAALVAPLGASAVLVFVLPASPLAQPWSVLGGNTLSALIGVACASWIPHPALGAATAVALAIALMLLLHCLHPPGGAMALMMVLTGNRDFHAVLDPVLLDASLLVAAGLLYNNLTGRRWPHVHRTAAAPDGARLTRADLDAALARFGQVLDIDRDDLQALLQDAEAAAYHRTLGELRCADVMLPVAATASADMRLHQAWALMRKHRVKALPVVEDGQRLVGIVTVADFLRQVDLDVHEGMAWRLRALLHRVRGQPKPVHTVGDIMTREVSAVGPERLLIDLVAVISDGDHRHIPVLDDGQRLLGMVTQSTLIQALAHAVRG